MTYSLVVPLDGSELAETALPIATAIAERTDAAVHLVHVRRMTPAAADLTDSDEAAAYIARMRARVADDGATVSAALLPDEPPQLLLPTPSPRSVAALISAYAGTHDASLVVMTTHGRGGLSRMWFGSVADAMLRVSTTPLLLVRPGPDERPVTDISHVLVALGADDDPAAILDTARLVATPFQPRYTLIHVLPALYALVGDVPGAVVLPPMDDAARSEAAHHELSRHAPALQVEHVDTAAPFDPVPAHGILEFAEAHHVDLIIVGTHSRHGADRLILGSVADKVVRGASCSVLVVPPRA